MVPKAGLLSLRSATLSFWAMAVLYPQDGAGARSARLSAIASGVAGHPAIDGPPHEEDAMTNVARMLADSVAAHGDRPAIKLDDIVLSYTALDEASARAAGLLAERGVGPGDRVGLMLGNSRISRSSSARCGSATSVPMNPLLKEREVAFHLSDSGARALSPGPGSPGAGAGR